MHFWSLPKKQEEALRVYEGANYEVIRCSIEMEDTGSAVRGLTFRFRGTEKLS